MSYWYPHPKPAAAADEPPDLHTLAEGWRPEKAIRNNGPNELALERFKLRELAEGWPMYRDACEWENFRSIFHPTAYVYTTWTGRIHHLDFIEASKFGMDRGAFIMHRCHGCTTDINPEATRAVTKMKATITQRFDLNGYEIDVEVDCRFCFFWEKVETTAEGVEIGEWRAMLVRHWYEKDKAIAVNPENAPQLNKVKLAALPQGYRYLAYCQEATMGATVVRDMPGHRRDGGNANGKAHDDLYEECKKWVEGEKIYI